jgi:hypothetical protein
VRLFGRTWVAAAAGLVALAAAGCGTSPPSPAKPTGAPPLPYSSQSTSRTATIVHIGSGCGIIPVHGAGSFGSMGRQRAVDAASSNPQLSVFTSAIRSAALADELDKMRSFTLFVPVNSAFAALSASDVSYLRRSANLVKVVRGQVVPDRITPARIARGGSVTSLSGRRITLGKSGTAYRVSQATVVCGNIRTANGTIYVIDRVLLPPR